MRKILLAGCAFLAFTGFIITGKEEIPFLENNNLVEVFHLWVGMFFIVIFPMYSWDHIRLHQKRLKKVSGVSISGIIQLLSGLGLILSGILLWLYESNALKLFVDTHFYLTFLLLLSLAGHFLIKK